MSCTSPAVSISKAESQNSGDPSQILASVQVVMSVSGLEHAAASHHVEPVVEWTTRQATPEVAEGELWQMPPWMLWLV